MLSTRSYPPLTGYHLLVNVSVAGFGITKAVLTYCGFTTTPNVLDWVSVVIIGVGCADIKSHGFMLMYGMH